jgi:hypothetical protein
VLVHSPRHRSDVMLISSSLDQNKSVAASERCSHTPKDQVQQKPFPSPTLQACKVRQQLAAGDPWPISKDWKNGSNVYVKTSLFSKHHMQGLLSNCFLLIGYSYSDASGCSLFFCRPANLKPQIWFIGLGRLGVIIRADRKGLWFVFISHSSTVDQAGDRLDETYSGIRSL